MSSSPSYAENRHVLDVRPAEEYRAGHLPGAVSIPLQELEQRIPELPRGGEIVAYCRGAYCVMAYEALDILRATDSLLGAWCALRYEEVFGLCRKDIDTVTGVVHVRRTRGRYWPPSQAPRWPTSWDALATQHR
ncbi:MAG: rhodanese-like domain-containing protein [Propionibacteriaceae bacterium]